MEVSYSYQKISNYVFKLPYGEEIYRPTQGTDKVRQKFTGYERDAETDLDFAQARMYHKNHGRFTSPDPIFLTKERMKHPEMLNLYVYVGNNPLIYVDPDGRDIKVSKYAREFYMENLEKATPSFNVKLNKSGKVQIVDENGKTLSKKELKELGGKLDGKEKELFNAITDKKHHVSITATKNDPTIFLDQAKGDGKQVFDLGDTPLLSSESNSGGLNPTELVTHATIEAYRTSQGDSPLDAHNYANNIPGAEAYTTASVFRIEENNQGQVTSYTINAVKAGDPSNLTRITFVLPKPLSPPFGIPYGTPTKMEKIPTRQRIVP
jgi:RHS repeat-associated protein